MIFFSTWLPTCAFLRGFGFAQVGGAPTAIELVGVAPLERGNVGIHNFIALSPFLLRACVFWFFFFFFFFHTGTRTTDLRSTFVSWAKSAVTQPPVKKCEFGISEEPWSHSSSVVSEWFVADSHARALELKLQKERASPAQGLLWVSGGHQTDVSIRET